MFVDFRAIAFINYARRDLRGLQICILHPVVGGAMFVFPTKYIAQTSEVWINAITLLLHLVPLENAADYGILVCTFSSHTHYLLT